MNDSKGHEAGEERPRIQSAARAIDILQLIARSDASGLTAKEISLTLKVPRQVVYHLAHTLVAVNMLRRGTGHAYLLGVGVTALSQGFLRQVSGSRHMQRFADAVAAEIDGTAFVKGWVNDEVVTMATARGNNLVQAAEPTLVAMNDLHARASGKLLLSMRTDEEVLTLLRRRPMIKRTPNTLTSYTELMVQINEIRKQGLSVDEEEYQIGLSSVAVPLGTAPSQLALGVSMPTERFKPSASIIIERLREAAAKMSHRL